MLKIYGSRVLVLRLKLVAREVHVTILDRTHEVHVKCTRQLMSIFDVFQKSLYVSNILDVDHISLANLLKRRSITT